MNTHDLIPTQSILSWVDGPPEGRDYAPPGYMEIDSQTGNWWRKTTPQEYNTGWVLMADSLTITTIINNLNCFLGIYKRSTIGDARMIPTQNSTCPPVLVFTDGMDSPDDGQGGWFSWDGNCMEPDTGLSVWYADDNPYPGPGAWRQRTGVA